MDGSVVWRKMSQSQPRQSEVFPRAGGYHELRGVRWKRCGLQGFFWNKQQEIDTCRYLKLEEEHLSKILVFFFMFVEVSWARRWFNQALCRLGPATATEDDAVSFLEISKKSGSTLRKSAIKCQRFLRCWIFLLGCFLGSPVRLII